MTELAANEDTSLIVPLSMRKKLRAEIEQLESLLRTPGSEVKIRFVLPDLIKAESIISIKDRFQTHKARQIYRAAQVKTLRGDDGSVVFEATLEGVRW